MDDDNASITSTMYESCDENGSLRAVDTDVEDVESMLDEDGDDRELMEVDTEVEEDSDEEEDTKSGLILTEMTTEAMEAEHGGDSNSSSSNSDGKSEEKDDDSRGSKKPSKSPDLSPPMSRKRRIQDVAPADDNIKSTVCNLPTDLEIREGSEFQAIIPEYEGRSSAERCDEVEKETSHWIPQESTVDDKIEAYCTLCEVSYGLNRHQSLYLLHKASYDIESAKELCAKRANFKGEWSTEDKNLFQHCLNVFGKNFARIKNAMPHKTTAALVQQYYDTKKTHSSKSSFDVDHAHKEDEDNESIESSDTEDEQCAESANLSGGARPPSSAEESQDSANGEVVVCTNCNHHVNKLHDCDQEQLCTTCYLYLVQNNEMRPCRTINENHHRKCPHEMADVVAGFHRYAQIVSMENGKEESSDQPKVYQGMKYVVDLDLQHVNKNLNEVHARIAQIEKKINDFDFRGADKDVDNFKKITRSMNKSKSTRNKDHWTDREMTIAFHVLVLYEDDYARVTKFVRTKNIAQIAEFAEKHGREIHEARLRQVAMDDEQNEVVEEDGDKLPVLTKEEFDEREEVAV